MLGDIEIIKNSVQDAQMQELKYLQKIVYPEDKRISKRRLLMFQGFNLNEDSDEFNDKLKKIIELIKYENLVNVCNILNISNEGQLEDLAKLILQSLNDFKILEQNLIVEDRESSQYSESSSDSEEIENKVKDVNLNDKKPNVFINFSDIESVVPVFKGESNENVINWFDVFDSHVEIFGLSELQKYIFLKRCLKGKALLLIKSEHNINSYSKLKKLLIEEFHVTYNSAQVHSLLTKRKMKYNESYYEYYLNMKEIASQGQIEDVALIKYIIEGITDSIHNKSILYGAKTLKEFKDKLKIYEDICRDKKENQQMHNFQNKNKFQGGANFQSNRVSNNVQSNRVPNTFQSNRVPNNYQQNRVPYNYQPNRVQNDTYQNKKEIRCYKCNRIGHKSPDCRDKKYPIDNKQKNKSHSSQGLPPKPCWFCEKLGLFNVFHWGQFCVNNPSNSNTNEVEKNEI